MKHTIPIRFRYYLAAILVPVFLAAPVGIIVWNKIGNETELNYKKIVGLNQVQHLGNIINDLQSLRGLGQILLLGKDDSIKPKLVDLEKQLDLKLADFRHTFSEDPFAIVDDLVLTLRSRPGSLAEASTHRTEPMERFDRDTAPILQVQNIVQDVSIRSNMVNDPEVYIHFLATLVIDGLPDMEEAIGRTRGLGSGFLSNPGWAKTNSFRFWEQLGLVKYSREEVNRSRRIVEIASGQTVPITACLDSAMKMGVQNFLDLGQTIITSQQEIIDPNHFFVEGTTAINAIRACKETLRRALLDALTQRYQSAIIIRRVFVIGSGLSLLLVLYFVGTFYRINRTAFGKLHNSLNQNQSILNSAVDGIITIDERGIIHSVNASLEKMFCYPPGELLGQNVSQLMPSPFREAHDGYLRAYLTSNKAKIIGTIREVACIGKDGRMFPAELSVGTFSTAGNHFFTGILHDITERKQTKDALQAAYGELEQRIRERTRELETSNSRLQKEIAERNQAQEGLKLAAKVFENASEAIVITDKMGTIIDVNQAYTFVTGFSRSEVIGKNPRIGKSGKHDQDFYAKMWKEIITSGRWSGEIWDRRKNGESYPKWLTINAVYSLDGDITHFVGIFTDISHMKATEERLEQLAFYDHLTTLPNRMLFRDRLLHEFESAKRFKKLVGVFFIDLDRFKHVNDTLGHAAGDMLLVEVARRIAGCVRTSDTVSRLGGDEFTVILAGLECSQEAEPIARKIIHSLMNPIRLNEHEAHIGASIGISIFPEDGDDYDTITKYADVAMYHAKESGRGNFKFFEEQMNSDSVKRAELEHNLRQAITSDELVLHYQPKITIATGTVTGMESLVRWRRSNGTMVSPADFIPLAEETGLIIPMGEIILQSACRFNKARMQAGGVPLRVAVNLSARQFQQKNLHELVERTLRESDLDPQWLELEVTESMMMQDEKQAIVTLTRLRDIGISVAMDDFGTGYSSLSHLKRLPIQSLKIDQSFVRDLTENSDDAAIVLAIVSMAKSLKLHVVAEGVETKDQAEFLKKIACDELQGYYFSRPLAEDAFVEFIANAQPFMTGENPPFL